MQIKYKKKASEKEQIVLFHEDKLFILSNYIDEIRKLTHITWDKEKGMSIFPTLFRAGALHNVTGKIER